MQHSQPLQGRGQPRWHQYFRPMATKSHNSTPFSRFSRLGLGLAFKSSNSVSPRIRDSEKPGSEDEWYIPYSGPYEPPRELFQPKKERDSWGDPINREDDDEETALATLELHKRYDIEHSPYPGGGRPDGALPGTNVVSMDAENAAPRNRTQSGVSGRTGSSGAVDPSRISMPAQRRSTISSSQRPLTSYINLDAAGGVGESPMPPTHQCSSSKETNRASIAGLFSLGGQGRSKLPSERGSNLFSRKLSRARRPSTSTGISHIPGSHRHSSSSGSDDLVARNNALPLNGNYIGASARGQEDYYNSYYYSTAISSNPDQSIAVQSPHLQRFPSNAKTGVGEKIPSPTLPSRHPYAYVFPPSDVPDGPQTAPLPQPHNFSTRDTKYAARSGLVDSPLKLTSTAPPPPPSPGKPSSADVSQSQFSLSWPIPFSKGIKRLKGSASTPDLRFQSNPSLLKSRNKQLPNKPSPTFNGGDRWLSAETWCDALLFPRPRLKISEGGEQSSGRIVSPPDSPVQRGLRETDTEYGKGVVSRVLAHSRSAADLAISAGPSTKPDEGLHPPQDGLLAITHTERPPRPRSFALDDLALPTPVPSLAR